MVYIVHTGAISAFVPYCSFTLQMLTRALHRLSSIGVIFLVGKIMTHGLEQPEAYSYEQFAFKGNSLSFVGLSVLTNKRKYPPKLS